MVADVLAGIGSLPFLAAPVVRQVMWDDNGWGWGAWFFMTLAMIAFWGAVIFLVVWFVRGGSRPAAMPPTSRGTALDIAAERYARGEISEEEFARIKHGLAS